MPEIGKLYCTQRDLESIRHECQRYTVPIDDSMLLWTPAEARAYFISYGAEKPNPKGLAKRSIDDAAPKRTGLAQNERECCIGLCCCCCDTAIMAWLDGRSEKKSKQSSGPQTQQQQEQEVPVVPGTVVIART